MVLDMEGEFYKIAKRILGKPKNLYKMTSISPNTGRVTIMGADGYMMVGSSLLKPYTRKKGPNAYSAGKRCGRDMFKKLIEEFDEEVENLSPKKLFDLGLRLATNTGWGQFELDSIKQKRHTATISAIDTVEMKYPRAEHHMLTAGFIAGISSLCFGKKVRGTVSSSSKNKVIFSVSPE